MSVPGLREKVKRYEHRELVERDCAGAMETFKDISAKVDSFKDERGNAKQLLCLSGTIPVMYREKRYNIPVSAWLMEKHPYTPPYVFVNPTSNMVIKEGRHVNKSGKVFCPYLHEWKHPGHDLVALFYMLSMIFSEEMPVFSVTSQQSSYHGYQGGHQGGMSYGGYGPYSQGMPLPNSNSGMPMPMPYPGGGMPGYPTSSAGGGMPTPYSSSGGPPHSAYQGSSQPPYPSGRGGSQPPYPPVSSSMQPPYPMGPSGSQPPYPPVGTSYGQTGSHHHSASTGGFPPYNAPRTTSNSYSGSMVTSTNERQSSLDEDAVRASLLSAVEDKLTRRVKEVFELAKSETDSLTSTKSKLESGAKELAQLQEKLTQQTITIENSNQILEQKNSELKEMVEKLASDTESMNIDDAIVTTAPLYNQIFDLFAEENAIEDAIYFLGEALRREVIELDAFLKTVRKLSRKMFMLRAQLQKARQTAGLS